MNRNPILVALLAIFMVSATTLSVQATEYFHADPKARLYNEMSSFQVMRNDLVLKKMNSNSNIFGFAVAFFDKKCDSKHNERYFARFVKTNPGKKNYFVIFVGPDMKATCASSNTAARTLANNIVFKSMYGGEDRIFAGLLVMNTVETMRHR